MHQNIKNKHSRVLDSKLYNGHYYDFMLYKGETSKLSEIELESMLIADFSSLNIVDGVLYSDVLWSGATNNGVVMNDIGLTGVDNGFICFDKSKISPEEFLEIFLHSTYSIESGDTRLFMTPITGNTQLFEYPMYLEENDEKYLSFKGGFYQGFFKLDGFEYQVLPEHMTEDLLFHFEIRPRTDYTISDNTVNNLHPNNNGIFFYLGTRAENKFWKYYKINPDDNDFAESQIENPYCDSIYDGIVDNEYFLDDYIGKETVIDEYGLTDSEGHELDKNGYYEIETDNKFIFFNRTDTGFTVDNWIEGSILRLQGRKKWNVNYFPILDRTDTGLTVNDLEDMEYEDLKPYMEANGITPNDSENDFNVYKDIRSNVFALRIREDGAIGYRYGILDCDDETTNKYKVVEEYSKEGLIKPDEWNSVNVRFVLLNSSDKCDLRPKKMKIMIYVNGFLIFISKELPSLIFKRLDEVYQKQEGVPYNISLGGGSQGLLEVIMPNMYELSQYVLPIEQDFCGTFIGDIKDFKIYSGFIDYSTIKNYLSVNKKITLNITNG